MLIEGVFAWLALLLVGVPALVSLRRRFTAGHLVALGLLLTYVAGVIDFTLLPIRTASAYAIDPPVVLQLFFLGHPEVMSRSQYIGNILLGIPFGFLVPFVARLSLPKVVAAGLGMSLLVEALQWVTSKAGIAYPTARAADVNDLLLNTFGVVVGVVGFVALRAIYRRVFPDWNSPPAIWEHFHSTLLSAEHLGSRTS